MSSWPVPLTAVPGEAAHAEECRRAVASKALEARLLQSGGAAPSVLYEDHWLLAVHKPAGRYCECVAAAAAAAASPGAGAATLAHRLDRCTSGVLLLPKGSASLAAVARAFQRHAVQKRYLALCAVQSPPPPCLLLRSGHGRSAQGLWRTYAFADVGRLLPHGHRVRAIQTCLRFFSSSHHGTTSLLLATPLQGRTHQIRLHAALAGAPLVGDVRYGGPSGEAACLHALSLRLPHPETGALLEVVAPMPDWVHGAPWAWKALLAELEKGAHTDKAEHEDETLFREA